MGANDFAHKQLEQLNTHLRTVLTTYFTWYAFFWTLNAGLLAVGYFEKSDSAGITALLAGTTVLFAVLSAFGVAVTMFVFDDLC
ncbi:MAG: hypothetical protein NCW75_04140 [Phycisphaera sp.]|nr:MAG: hypothetical protein NCW75_04140 [Phycisphaera sp.]